MTETAVKAYPMTNTHILADEFTYHEPRTLSDAIALASRLGDRAQLLAGGTWLVIQMKMERRCPDHVINISKIPGLHGIRARESGVEIGALTSIRDIQIHETISGSYNALAQACGAFGSTQIQMMGTIGGNLCNGSPASDTVPALLAFDARLRLAGPDGQREMPVDCFLVGPGKTAIRRGEIVTGVTLPATKAGTGSSFIKISRVRADLAKASVACVVVRDGDRIADCRLAFGSVAPTVFRARKAEDHLRGKIYSEQLLKEAGKIAADETAPIDDVRSTAWYRREIAKALTFDAMEMAWARAASPRDEVSFESTTDDADEAIPGEGYELAPDECRAITLMVNGERQQLAVAPNELLVNVLRERLELTGTKYGCGLGECGACTVDIDGRPALSCLVLAVAADGHSVTTAEGVQPAPGKLDPVQEAFLAHNAFQCGYCTPGMLIMTKALLRDIANPTQADIRDYLRGNRCRCTGFASIVRAVESCVQHE